MSTYWILGLGEIFVYLYGITPEIDYNLMTWIVRSYKRPRDQITKLLRSGEILRVKKGLYIRTGPDIEPYSLCILANLIYGPSYVSGYSALNFWSALPERVQAIESSTWNRKRDFKTPVGLFQYRPVPKERYARGLVRISVDERRGFIVSSREKSLLDVLERTWGNQPCNLESFESWLDSMRIDGSFLAELRIKALTELRGGYDHSLIDMILSSLRRGRQP
jgi:hypothetical protein